MAPEILSGDPHGIEADMWSIGIIIYQILSGKFPFAFRNIDDNILKAPVLFLGDEWAKISQEAKDLIQILLNKSQYDRLKAKDALNHPWFKKFVEKK